MVTIAVLKYGRDILVSILMGIIRRIACCEIVAEDCRHRGVSWLLSTHAIRVSCIVTCVWLFVNEDPGGISSMPVIWSMSGMIMFNDCWLALDPILNNWTSNTRGKEIIKLKENRPVLIIGFKRLKPPVIFIGSQHFLVCHG